MNAVQTFTFESRAVRTVVRDDEPWFVGKDVCLALEIAEHRSSLRRLDDDEKGVHTLHSPGGPQEVTIVSEPGVFQLVFTSRAPKAKAFKRWLAHEVLPALRRTGTYTVPGRAPEPDLVEIERLNAYVRVVSEAWQVYGRVAAKSLWERLPLPQVRAEAGALYDLPDEDGTGCLAHLLRAATPDGQSVRARLALAFADAPARAALATLGLKAVPGLRTYLAVAERGEFLDQVFAATPWATDWFLPLLSLDGAKASRSPIAFGAATCRAVMIPRALINGN
ncbi:MAG TPA: Bro-N domain-containing protein [Beijerinckiaceae bacterium]|nr:Bro-N domain-containing protein [Beijerinckiaceae bacterium]